MTRLFVDTSALVALAFEEPGHEWVGERLASAKDLFAAPLLEAEFKGVLQREEVEHGVVLLEPFRWVLPDRPLSPELDRVFAAGYARGAAAWHLATALFLGERSRDRPFLSWMGGSRRSPGLWAFRFPMLSGGDPVGYRDC